MPLTQWAPHSQPESIFSLADVASHHGVPLLALADRVSALALSQGMTPVDAFFDTARFVLATREQVEDLAWCQRVNVSLFVRCTGSSTKPYRYKGRFADKVGQLPVNWPSGRNACLDTSLWDVLLALSQGGTVVIHCNQSFHRGLLGFMAVLRRLFGLEPRLTMELIVARRTVYEAYASEDIMRGFYDILGPYQWACGLSLWTPPSIKVADASWGARKGAGASSSAASSQAAAPSPAAASSSQGQQPPNPVSKDGARARAKQGSEPPWKGRYLYRAMTNNLSEFAGADLRLSQCSGERLAVGILQAIETGSRRGSPSPFLHFSWKHVEARHWWVKGDTLRGEVGSLMCRVDSLALSQAVDLRRPLEALTFIDMSTQKSAQAYISEYTGVDAVQERLSQVAHANKVAEVLVAWRGALPMSLFEVIDPNSGEFVRMLDAQVLGLEFAEIFLYYHTIIPSYYHTIILSYCQSVRLSYYHTVILSDCHTVILSFFPTVILSYCHTIVLSYYRTIMLSFYHSIIPSYYHTIIPSLPWYSTVLLYSSSFLAHF